VMPSSRPFLERIGELLERFRPCVGLDLLVYTSEEMLTRGVVLYESSSGTLAPLPP
jgi:hypothetical protein